MPYPDSGFAATVCTRQFVSTSNDAGLTMTISPAHIISEHELYLRLFVTNGGGW